MQWLRFLIVLMLYHAPMAYATHACPRYQGVQVQVLGSGGPELTDQRASSSYVVWVDGKATLLIDIGSGSLLQLEKAKIPINDIDAVLLTHLHVDHSSDLPALIKASFFSDRSSDLHIIGPSGNQLMPAISVFVERMFGKEGVYPYLSSYLNGSESYQIITQDIPIGIKQAKVVLKNNEYQVSAIPVMHGPIPAVAWQITIGGTKLVFSGDMSHASKRLLALTQNADILVAHHAIPESSKGVARRLHMPPSVIGEIAATSHVKQLVLSHHMQRTLNQFSASEKLIRQHYQGPLYFADDLACYTAQ